VARICIVSPSPLGSNPRVVKEAGALAARGHVVHVVSIRNSELVDGLEADILSGATWTVDRIDLRPALRRRMQRIVQAPARLASTVPGVSLDTAHSPLTRLLSQRARRWPADLYIGHYVAALPAVARAARERGALYAFDAEDFHPGDLPRTSANAFDQRLIEAIEGRYLPGSAYVTAAAPGIAQAYVEAYGVKAPVVVRNVFPRSQAPDGPTPGGAQNHPSIFWFSQTIGPDRGLEAAVTALSLAASKPHLYLLGNLARGFAERLRAIAAQAGVADRVHTFAPIAPEAIERFAAQFDVGLAAETGHTPNRNIALTNKQFSYLLAGLPALMSDIPAHTAFAQAFPDATRLFKVDDPASLAAAMDHWLGSPERLAKARAAAYELAQSTLNWDLEQSVLTDCVEAALAGSGR
jgi:glycosyltransferase involved in cell wall biosynthesis